MEAEVLALKWNNHQSIFYQIICGLRTKSNYTDVTLACEGKFYPVHKLVLSTCSEYFSEIFDRTPCKNPVVVLKDIQCKDLEFLLDYMYIGEVNVRQNELSSLIKAAECLKVKGLAVRDDDLPQSCDSKHRYGEFGEQEQISPPAKRRRNSGDHRMLSLPPSEQSQDRISDIPQLEESNLSTDSSVPVHASDLLQHQTEQALPQNVTDEGPVEEAENEAQVNSTLSSIKIEQELEYEEENSFKSNQTSLSVPYENDQYVTEDETPVTKVESVEDKEVTEEGVMGVGFNDFLQSSLASSEGVDPHSSIHSQVDVDQSWDGGAISRSLASHGLASAVGAHDHHQQKAAVAALGLLHSSASESQSSLHLLQQQHGGGNVSDLFSQQQNVMVGEGSLMAGDFHRKKDKPPRDYVCQFCGREFGHRTNLQAHLRIHTGEKPFRCLYCPYRTALKGNLKMHTISRHKIDWKAIKHLVQPFADEENI